MITYQHLSYEQYKALEQAMRKFKETSHKTTGGFYHKSIRLALDPETIIEFHGPLVGGYGHNKTRRKFVNGRRKIARRRPVKRKAKRVTRKGKTKIKKTVKATVV